MPYHKINTAFSQWTNHVVVFFYKYKISKNLNEFYFRLKWIHCRHYCLRDIIIKRMRTNKPISMALPNMEKRKPTIEKVCDEKNTFIVWFRERITFILCYTLVNWMLDVSMHVEMFKVRSYIAAIESEKEDKTQKKTPKDENSFGLYIDVQCRYLDFSIFLNCCYEWQM